MADLTSNFAGIKSPNPFWLASAPPTNMGSMVERAFDAGWGGAVWKTLGEPIVNVSSRLAALDQGPLRMIGLNNIELITDRPLDVNLKEIAECKKKYPNNAVIISLMVESKREAWQEIVKMSQDTGADGFELNFGCPHGMSERGMGAAMGQVPEYTCMVTEWVKEVSNLPVIVKLTPNVTHIVPPGRAAQKGGADAVSLINTINSVMGIDVDTMIPYPNVNGMAAHGGYCGTAVKPIALNMVSELARDAEFSIPISGIGGINTWRDAVEFMLLGAGNVQVCTAVMHYGYRIVEDMIDGLNNYLDEKGFASVNDIIGKSVNRVTDWGNLDLNYKVIAHVNEEKCIQCNLCYVACEDGAHQSFEFKETDGKKYPVVIEEECVGCNLCALVCPSPGAISMVRVDEGGETRSWREMQEANS
jgi:dihydropyrimidine dehydrogenase (NAD+) subunit PreA